MYVCIYTTTGASYPPPSHGGGGNTGHGTIYIYKYLNIVHHLSQPYHILSMQSFKLIGRERKGAIQVQTYEVIEASLHLASFFWGSQWVSIPKLSKWGSIWCCKPVQKMINPDPLIYKFLISNLDKHPSMEGCIFFRKCKKNAITTSKFHSWILEFLKKPSFPASAIGTSMVLEIWLHSWYSSAMDIGAPGLEGCRVDFSARTMGASSSGSWKNSLYDFKQIYCIYI